MKRSTLILFVTILFVMNLNVPIFSQEVKKLTLDDCIQIALKNNTTIVSAKSSATMAAADLKSARGNFLPSVNGYSGWSMRDSEWNTIRFDQFVSSKESYYYQVELNQPIFTGFGNYASYVMNKAARDNSRFTLKWTQQTVILDVKFKYYNVLKQQQLLKVAEEALNTSQEELNRIQEMEKIGSTSRAEVYQQKVRMGQDKLALVDARNNVVKAKTELNYTLGIEITTPIELVAESGEITAKALKKNFDEAVHRALNDRLDYKVAQNNMKSARANVKYSRSTYYPNLAAFGRYSWWDVQFPQSKKDIDEFDSFTFGLNLSINIFNGLKNSAGVQKAKAGVISAEADLEQAKRRVTLDVKIAELEIEKALENLEVTKENVVSAEEDFRLASERYRIGAGTLIEQLIAQSSLTRAKVNRIQAIYDYKYAVTALDLAMGQLTW